jgi:hypothetical protein
MKKIILALIFGLISTTSFSAWIDGYNPVTRTVTSVTTNTQLAGSTLDCKKMIIKNSSSAYNALISFQASDTITAQCWPLAAGATFEEPFATNSAYGVVVSTTISTIPAITVNFLSVK